MTVVSSPMGKVDWPFATASSFPDADADPLDGAQHVNGLCPEAVSEYEGRRGRVFQCVAISPSLALHLRPVLTAPRCAGGVHNAGLATSHEAHEAAVAPLFASRDHLVQVLAGKDFLVCGRPTKEDMRLFVTIVRFDPIYVGRFECNVCTIRSGCHAIDL